MTMSLSKNGTIHGTYELCGFIWGFERLNNDGLIRFWKIRKARHLGALARLLGSAFIIGVGTGTAMGLAAVVTAFVVERF
jgi:hypothetical protein